MFKLFKNLKEKFGPQLVRAFKLFFGYFLSQVGMQVIGMVIGWVIIRTMTKDNYALYAIINTMGPVMLMLCDNGVGPGIYAIGGTIWQDNEKIGRLINTAMQLRRWFALASFVVVGPFLAWMLIRNHAPITTIVLLSAATMTAVSFQLSGIVMTSILQLRQQVKVLAKVGLASSLLRLTLVSMFAAIFHINAFLATLAGTLAVIFETICYIRAVKPQVVWDAPPNPEYRATILALVKKTMPLTVYFCIQGQISIWLISIFGSSHQVADIGATARIGVIFTTVTSTFSAIALPRFARTNGRRRLFVLFIQIMGSLIFILLSFSLFTALFPGPFIMLLGSQYSNMAGLLWLVVLSSGINVLAGIVYGLNMNKGWVPPAYVTIPVEIVTQIVLLLTLNLSKTESVLVFSAVAALPPTFVNTFMLLRRIRLEPE